MDEFILAAIAEARKGSRTGGIPIGSVLVKDKKIIGRGYNKRVQENNPVLHAEIDCLTSAGRIGSYEGTILYSTLMPCYLCAGAIVQFGIKKVIAGESKNFPGAVEFLKAHGVEVVDMENEECIGMMKDFISYNEKLWNEDIGKT
ncbi:MAG: nucleoside deaminase [Ignavibacteriales bacterium]|nr:MAG: nucleoside deaminase [Ignavibacteriales bacterium]